MKRQKGFTLIELLAVIVILAVIALIAVPIIMGIIHESKKGSAKDSMYGYVKAVELAGIRIVTATTDSITGTYTTQDGNLYQASTKALDVNFKGTKPENGGTVTVTNGQVTSAELTFDGIKVSYNGTEATVGDDDSQTSNIYANGTAIYYNPVTGEKCSDYTSSNSLNETKTGCMKWYAFNDTEDSSTVNLLLDHNTTYQVAWNSSGNNADGMKEVKEELDKLTSVSSWKDIPRLIEANEVAKITGNTEFDATVSGKGNYFYFDTNTGSYDPNVGEGTSAYKWLFDYTYNCTSWGCSIADSGTDGYWTSTPYVSNSSAAWTVYYNGFVDCDSVNYAFSGVRPVITISKSVIS